MSVWRLMPSREKHNGQPKLSAGRCFMRSEIILLQVLAVLENNRNYEYQTTFFANNVALCFCVEQLQLRVRCARNFRTNPLKKDGAQMSLDLKAPHLFNGRDQSMKLDTTQFNLSSGQFALEFLLQNSSNTQSTLLGVFDNGHSQGLSIDLNTNEQDRPAPGLTRFFLRDLERPRTSL